MASRLSRSALISSFVCLVLFSAFIVTLRGRKSSSDFHGIPSDLALKTQLATDISIDQPTANGVEIEKVAYATLLTATTADVNDTNDEQDHYFIATRILTWQLLHSSVTRTNRSIPFLVLVTEDVSQSKRDRLTLDGATVVPVGYVRDGEDWIHGEMPEWRDLFAKLRAWELIEYSRILFLDGDMILTGPLDEIFDAPAASPALTVHNESTEIFEDELPPPETYLFASTREVNPVHAPNPTMENGDFKDANYFNAGFFLFAPSLTLFKHYKSVMSIPNRFDPQYMEQNLLNYAHRRNGTMPWQDFGSQWNIRFPTVEDVATGVQSLHDKWWHPHVDERLREFYQEVRWRMEGYYEAWDRVVHGI